MPKRSKLTAALVELHNFLKNEKIQFMVIGGIANLVWGEPRLTQDIDVTILYPMNDLPYFIKRAGSHFRILPNNPLRFVERTKVLPVEVGGVRVDIILAGTEYEENALSRAKEVEIQEGIDIRVCSSEDLVIYKAISERERDWEDIEGIILRQGEKLDKRYILRWLNQFASALDRPDVIDRFNKLWKTLTKV